MGFDYEFAGRKVSLAACDDLLAVRFLEPATQQMREEIATSIGTSPLFSIPNEKFTLVQAAASNGTDPAFAPAFPPVARAGSVLQHGKSLVFATDRVLVGLRNHETSISQVLDEAGVAVVESRARGNGEFVIRLPATVDPMDVATQLSTNPHLRYAEPDFVSLGPRQSARRMASGASNPGPLKIAQRELDIVFARDAIESPVEPGPRVIIAVLDEGVDVTHPDLKDVVVGTFDAIDRDEHQTPKPWDGHGTACAGLAVARTTADGVLGVGAGCFLLAVRIAASAQPGALWSWSISQAADGIDWARENGADVLSNSWGGCPPSHAITEAFDRARTLGRRGRGCVVVVAAGNENAGVSYPGTLPGILTVSATNQSDEFKTTTSSDGDGQWGSNFGPTVRIAAPGVDNLTTDIVGAGGITELNYAKFSGTSAAAPLVAGAAGQILRRYPGLSGDEVCALLQDSADKIGPLLVDGGRNEQLGHGRLNVAAALALAERRHRTAPQ